MLDPQSFVKSRRPAWRELEREIEEARNTDFKDFDLKRARRLGKLYRQSSADLIRASTETANEPLIDYLNGLVGRAYGTIYRGGKINPWYALTFLAFDLPERIRKRFASISIAGAILIAGFLFGFFAEYLDSGAKYYLYPGAAAIEENIDALKAKAVGGGVFTPGNSSIFSAFITTNNVRVCFLSFALGATLGIGTVYVLFYNGVIVGVLGAICTRHQLSLYFWAYILPHGVIELFAIFVSGAAGFLVARALIAPGFAGRRAALVSYGREAIDLIFGCAALLIIAGFIEGFITPQGFIPHGIKLIFAGMTGLFLIAWFGFNEPILAAVGVLPPESEDDS